MNEIEKWKEFWQDKRDPLHRSSSAEHYQAYAAELSVLFRNFRPKRILELGCGNGALYEYLGFDKVHYYKGVDFSPSMLETFKKSFPNANLECRDASVFKDGNKYDMIFTNGLIQAFNHKILDKFFVNVKTMMKSSSLFVCGSLPWKTQKFKYATGESVPSRDRRFIRGLYIYAKRTLFNDPMGYWYSFSDIREISSKNGMEVEFYGSMNYLYRFHAVIRFQH